MTVPAEIRFDATIRRLFGAPGDAMADVDARARALYPDVTPIVWEGDAATFQFTFVSPLAEAVLGYPARRWIEEPTFWADVVVLPEDRGDAIAYCALATGKGRDHTFEYRARAADGRVVWLRDLVQVIPGARGIPERLRGVMFDVSAARAADAAGAALYREPSVASLGT